LLRTARSRPLFMTDGIKKLAENLAVAEFFHDSAE